MDNGNKTDDKPRPVSPINGQPIPNGRPKGVPNKSTTKAREAIAMFVEGNVDRLQSWLDAIAEKDPKLAYDCFMNTVEYHIPKLARQELTGADGAPIEKNVNVRYIDSESVPISPPTETL